MSGPTVSTSSGNVVAMDTQPLLQLTAGEGKEGDDLTQDDYIHLTTGMLAANQGWRMCRIPTSAKIKRVTIVTDAILDTSSSQGLAFDINVAFSDSTQDGTQASLQGQIPTTANTGATTSPATYASPNKLFGTVTLSGNDLNFPPLVNGKLQPLDVTFGGGSLLYNSQLITETPLWQLFGFVNAQGYPADPGGYFDIYFATTVAAATAAAGNLFCRVEYSK